MYRSKQATTGGVETYPNNIFGRGGGRAIVYHLALAVPPGPLKVRVISKPGR